MRAILVFAASLALISTAHAAPCRDAHGRFMKCSVEKPVRCRDAHGRFAKCGAPGVHPV